MPKFEVNLKNSLNTDTISEDVRAFADTTAPVLQNTGIERDGGVTNIYETVESYGTAGDHFITEDGNILESVVSGDQRLMGYSLARRSRALTIRVSPLRGRF
jgi:hypothetical protein